MKMKGGTMLPPSQSKRDVTPHHVCLQQLCCVRLRIDHGQQIYICITYQKWGGEGQPDVTSWTLTLSHCPSELIPSGSTVMPLDKTVGEEKFLPGPLRKFNFTSFTLQRSESWKSRIVS
jgi:hypothetical protein